MAEKYSRGVSHFCIFRYSSFAIFIHSENLPRAPSPFPSVEASARAMSSLESLGSLESTTLCQSSGKLTSRSRKDMSKSALRRHSSAPFLMISGPFARTVPFRLHGALRHLLRSFARSETGGVQYHCLLFWRPVLPGFGSS